MMNLVEWNGKSGPILLELVLLYLGDRGYYGEFQQLLDLPGAGEPNIQHLHCQCATDANAQSKDKRHHKNASAVWITLPPVVRRRDNPNVPRPKCRLLFRDL